jgi:outer membrane protein
MLSQSAFGEFTSPGTNASVRSTFVPELVLTYFVTDNIALETPLGIPPKLELVADGTAAPLGPSGPKLPLDGFRPLATARAWAPMLVAKYYFGQAESKFRPFIGAGVNYTTFSGVSLNSEFESILKQFAGPGGRVDATATSSWNPVFTAGASYNINERWFLTMSATYLPLKTKASFNAVDANGHVVLGNSAKISANPVLLSLRIGYSF